MKVIDYLRDFTEKIKQKINSLNFLENDVRKAYYENLYSILNEFYVGKVFFEISREIKNGHIKFDQEIFNLKNHILRLYEIADNTLLSNSYQNELNRKIFSDSFTNFESTVDLCFNQVVNDRELDVIIEDINSKVFKICKGSDSQKNQLLEHFRKSTFIPLIRKFKFLAKRIENCYSENYISDIEFITFCSNLRNCILHSAGYWKGKDYEYEFAKVRFIFRNEEFLEMKGNNDLLFVEINTKLSEIIEEIYECLSDFEFIQYPDDGF